MSLPINYIGVEGDSCRCGRRASIIHCPACGSFKCVYRASASEMRGSERISRFKCNKCGLVFEEYDWKNHCEAPVYMTKTQRLAQDMVDAQKAKQRSEPLTKREETLTEVIESLKPEQTPERKKKEEELKREWVRLKLTGKTEMTVEEFLFRRIHGEQTA